MPSRKQKRISSWAIPVGAAGALLLAGVFAWPIHGSTPAPLKIRGVSEALASLPKGVTLKQIDGGPNYYAKISPGSAWMDHHILLGAWEEQPLSAKEVKYDVAMGNNIYWNLAGNPIDTKDCGGSPCRVNYNVIRAGGMHASAPDVTSKTGSETVAFEGSDEADQDYSAGFNGWSPKSTNYNQNDCIPSGSACGYTVARFFYNGKPSSYGSPGYPVGKKPITQGYGKGVLFWMSDAQAAKFLTYSNTLSADSYWMTDPTLDYASQGGCAIFSPSSTECGGGGGRGLTTLQRALPANYAFDVTEIERLQAKNGASKPITVDVETGCPFSDNNCINPAASKAAAWHALIAGARGIIWFQHNFGGQCQDDRTFYDGSNPSSRMYNCQQTSGVTLHSMVQNISAFNHRVGVLNGVLLSPFALHYVSVGGADVSVMAKNASGKFYVFAASGTVGHPPANNMPVHFKVAGNYTGVVTVVGENRALHAANGVFTDTFANADTEHTYIIGK